MKRAQFSKVKIQKFDRKEQKMLGVFVLSVLILVSWVFAASVDAAGINKTINFQGKLTKSDGTNVADNTYSVVFTLYDASSGGTNLWTETQSVTTSNGNFQIALGSVTSLAAVNFNSDTIYLGIKVGSDSEMTPRIRFGAVPYAFNADKLNGVTATQSATGFNLQGGSSTLSTISFTTLGSTLTFQPGTAGGLTIESNGANGLTFDTGGGAAINIGNTNATSLVFGNSTSNPSFAFNGTGGLTIANGGNNNITLGSNAGNGTVVIQPNAGGQAGLILNDQGSGDLFTASSSGTTKFSITSAGGIRLGASEGSGLECLLSGGIGSAAMWSSCPSAASNWDISNANGTVTTKFATVLDLLLGGTSTDSAKFAFINVAGGTPTASIAGNMTLNSSGVIDTTKKQTLIIGSSQTGNIIIDPTGDSQVGIGFAMTPQAALDVHGKSATQAVASVSGRTNLAAMIVDNSDSGDVLSASSSGLSRLTVKQNGDIVVGDNGVGGQLIASNNGIEFTESDTNPTCAVGNFNIYADLSENKLKKCQNGTVTDLDPALATMQSFTSYDSSEAVVAVPTTLVVSIATVSATPTSATGDVYVRGKAQLQSGSNTDQTFTMSLRKNTCSGTIISSNVLTITSASGTTIGDFELSGVDVNPGTGTTNYILCGSVTGATTNIVWHEVFAQVVDNGADYAELYTTSDATLGAGDVIELDNALKAGVKKTQKAYDPAVMGIVATRPGQVIGGVDQEGVKAVPIALAGRVPVKVSTESGAILPGDFLAPSSTPGVAMKATEPGFVIGQAMTGYGGDGVGTVISFVRNQWYDPGVTLLSVDEFHIQQSSDAASLQPANIVYSLLNSAGTTVHRVGAFSQAAIGNIQIGYGVAQGLTVDGYLNVRDNITTGILAAGEITTNSLTVTSENISIGGQTLRDYIASIVIDVLSKQAGNQQPQMTTAVSGLLTQQSGEKLFKQLLAKNVLGASTSATLVSVPDVSVLTASSSAVTTSDDTLALKSLDVEGLATISSTLRVKQNSLVEGVLTVVDTLMTKNLVVSGVATFLDDVVFKGNVAFATPPKFSKDTAGFAIIKQGSDKVQVTFDKPYENVPVVNVSISLDETTGDTDAAAKQQRIEQSLLGSGINYIVTKRTANGFTILLNKPVDEDISFSWTALAVNDPQTFESKQTILLSPTPTPFVPSPSPAGGNPQGEEVIQHEGSN